MFESVEAGVFVEYENLFGQLLDAVGLPGHLYGGLGAKLNAFVSARRVGAETAGAEPASTLFSRWAVQFLNAQLGYRKGRVSVSLESWGRRRYVGPERLLNDVGRASEEGPRIVMGYMF